MARIFIIDDDHDLLLIMKSVLLSKGHEPFVFASGAAFLEGLKKHTPDLVITDIVMPGVTGGTIYKMLRKAMGPQLPIIVSSGTRMRIDRVDPLMRHMIKPVDFDELFVVIDQMLKSSGFDSQPEDDAADDWDELDMPD
ncbi:response regulator [Candidatus Sumerlaeota bacterium]|nr:response regulator [Candidatus Sumerlaeota bacterium]